MVASRLDVHLTTYSHLAFGALPSSTLRCHQSIKMCHWSGKWLTTSRSLPPSLVTWIWSLKPIWWKNRPNSQVVSWPLHVYHGTYAQPPHTDKCHNYDNDNNDKNTVTFLILVSPLLPGSLPSPFSPTSVLSMVLDAFKCWDSRQTIQYSSCSSLYLLTSGSCFPFTNSWVLMPRSHP